MERRRPPQDNSVRRQNEYLKTIAALDDGVVADGANSSRGSLKTEERDAVWNVDIFGAEHDYLSTAQIAHPVPAGPTVASLFTDVARCVLAIEDHEDDPAANREQTMLQKAIHGVSLPQSNGKLKREDQTGLKHFVCNRLRLFNQVYYDTKPLLFIIPVMSVDEAKAWDGQAYPAIVIAGGADTRKIYKRIEMTEVGTTAICRQVEKARSLLSQAVQGLFYSLKYRQEIVERGMNADSRDMLRELRHKFKTSKSISVPSPLMGPTSLDATYNPNAPTLVRLIEFADHGDEQGHPAPDPLLLAFRAAINWSCQNDQDLLKAAAEPPELEDDLYRQAEVDFLAARERRALERQKEELIGLTIKIES